MSSFVSSTLLLNITSPRDPGYSPWEDAECWYRECCVGNTPAYTVCLDSPFPFHSPLTVHCRTILSLSQKRISKEHAISSDTSDSPYRRRQSSLVNRQGAIACQSLVFRFT